MITDVVMPEMGGAELASAASGVRPEMRVLFMSAYTDDAIIRNGVLNRERAFIHKPWTPAAFLAKVREMIKTQQKPAA
jgi:response regulator RpfG family c-di-GMP phosphodiesterase